MYHTLYLVQTGSACEQPKICIGGNETCESESIPCDTRPDCRCKCNGVCGGIVIVLFHTPVRT